MKSKEPNKKLAERRRELRRHMIEYGLQSLPLEEVVELILYFTIRNRDVRPIARELINRFGSIDRMAKASSAERKSIPGIGDVTDHHFAMIAMFIPHVLRNRFGDYPVFNNEKKLMDFCVSLHVMNEYEVLYMLCLNSGNHLIKKEVKLATGTHIKANIELKHIMDAVANTATAKVVLCHNHPGGSLKPSTDDINFTAIVKNSLERISIQLLDHIIVADNSAISMRALKLLN